MKEIIVDGKVFVEKNSINIEGEIKIVVLQRGWVMVGILKREENNCKLYKSHTIRRWGTSQGLGELAKNGKLENTVLDKNNGVVQFDYLTVCYMLECEEEKWKNEL